eukprot:Skav201049  [mRNA]  locus=scaffold3386:366734:374090:- [translate_table: standard]
MDNATDPPDAVDDSQNFKLALTIISIAVLTFLSQTFTGGENLDVPAVFPGRILPLRQKGNLLLCTILLGNTAVNAAMAQLLLGFRTPGRGLIGFLLTTAIIVILCEIENLLDRSQLQALVEYQKSAAPGALAEGQAEMLIGALGMAQKTVSEVMVKLETACTLSPKDRNVATLPRIFSQQHVNKRKLMGLLRELRPQFIPKRTELYRSGFETTKVTLVLQGAPGAFHLTSGADSCESTLGPWACLGVGLLMPTKGPPVRYTSDFTAVALTDAFVLQIEHDRYLQAAASDRLDHLDSLA